MKNNVRQNADGLARPLLILLIVVAVLTVGAIGYAIGSNNAEAEAKAKYDQQVKTMQEELDEAKATAAGTLEEGQEAVQEGQQTLESLQAENTQLKQTIEQQKEQIADLEQRLEDAQSDMSAQ